MPARRDIPEHIHTYWAQLQIENPNVALRELAVVLADQFPGEFAGMKPNSIYALMLRTKDREVEPPDIKLPTNVAKHDETNPGHLYRDSQIAPGDLPRSITYTWDLETTNLNSFLGRLIVASFLDMSNGKIESRTLYDYLEGPATVPNTDRAERQLVEWVVDRHEEADALIGHNTVGFDNGFIRGRLEALQIDRKLPKRQHWDTMQIAKFGFKGRPQGASMENLADFFRLPIQKDKPSKYDWAGSIHLDPGAIERITFRCEEDVRVNALLWGKLREYLHSWRGK